jgi:hypothetical protein
MRRWESKVGMPPVFPQKSKQGKDGGNSSILDRHFEFLLVDEMLHLRAPEIGLGSDHDRRGSTGKLRHVGLR